jgi:hypothetical protein
MLHTSGSDEKSDDYETFDWELKAAASWSWFFISIQRQV